MQINGLNKLKQGNKRVMESRKPPLFSVKDVTMEGLQKR